MALNNPYALSFDGVDDYVDCRQKISLSTRTQPFTFKCCVQGSGPIIATNRDGEAIGDARINITNTLGYYHNCLTSAPYLRSAIYSKPLDPLIFYFIVVIADFPNNKITFVVNGDTEEFSFSVNEVTLQARLTIGTHKNYTYDTSYFSGIIDEIGLWNRALTIEEALLCCNKKLRGNEIGLVAYYSCDEDTGNVLIDSTPNCNHGVIYGAARVPGIVNLELGYIDVATVMPVEVKYNSMTLKGNLRGLGDYPQAECYFQYTTDPNFETGIIETLHQALLTPGEFEQTITGLDNSKTYYYRAVATGINL